MEFGASVPHLTKANVGVLALATGVVAAAAVAVAIAVGPELETAVGGGSSALIA